MKEVTKEWIKIAETDLKACETLLSDEFLANIVAFHAQQVVEKCFKAIIEEQGIQMPHIHSLTRLFGVVQSTINFDVDSDLLQKADNLYTTSRYPSDMGLMPNGKPSAELAKQLLEFAQSVYGSTLLMLK